MGYELVMVVISDGQVACAFSFIVGGLILLIHNSMEIPMNLYELKNSVNQTAAKKKNRTIDLKKKAPWCRCLIKTVW